ncbi:MAG: mandelate racemase/muconate lactonizing enzyme family protein [Alphaproteobacteria bacterium]|nr:mandelate racemase/muconate lactonizing enzyme family protein [Alphaproteobacteria bacterium]
MKITKIETIWFQAVPEAEWRRDNPLSRQALPNNLWVRIHTDTGLAGLGETYYLPRAVAAVIHDVFAPLLLGRDPREIENHWSNMFSLVNFCGYAGAEMRAISAVDVALWDVVGQHHGEPIYNLLGGRNRDRIRVYNTCVGYGRYPDYDAWTTGRAGELAADLVDQGITAMKIWPFDAMATTLSGPDRLREPFTIWGATHAGGILCHDISNDDLKRGVAIVEDIRRAVGDRIAIAIEGHARWNLPTATRIARALAPYDIMWLEEMMPPDNVEAFVRLKASTTIPICQSERVFTRFNFRPWVEKPATDIVMPDFAWGGGISEGRKICSLADTYFLPVTSHDTIGPVALWSAAHLMLHVPNAYVMEMVRGYVDGWYDDVLTDRIEIRDGHLTLPGRPGLGTRLHPDFTARPNARVEVTTLEDLRRW